jgi:hypothetical protein
MAYDRPWGMARGATVERPGPADATPEKGPETDPLTAIAIQPLSQAVELLREDVEREWDRAERQAEEGRKRIDELPSDLADARMAAISSGNEAAVLRTQHTLLTDERRRPWWRLVQVSLQPMSCASA